MRLGYSRLPVSHLTGDGPSKAGLAAKLLCEPGEVFIDCIPPGDGPSPERDRAISLLTPGSMLVVASLHSLGRTLHDLTTVRDQVHTRGAAILIMDLNLKSDGPEGQAFFAAIAPIIDFQRLMLRELRDEGVARALAQGRPVAPEAVAKDQAESIMAMRSEGATIARIARSLSISERSVYRVIRSAREAETDRGGNS